MSTLTRLICQAPCFTYCLDYRGCHPSLGNVSLFSSCKVLILWDSLWCPFAVTSFTQAELITLFWRSEQCRRIFLWVRICRARPPWFVCVFLTTAELNGPALFTLVMHCFIRCLGCGISSEHKPAASSLKRWLYWASQTTVYKTCCQCTRWHRPEGLWLCDNLWSILWDHYFPTLYINT